MTTEKIFIGIDNERIELTGAEKEEFEAQRQEAHKVFLVAESTRLAKESARESALAKLAALGLTEEEIAAL